MNNPRTVVVTGGAGVIGSHLVDHILKMGYSVIVIDNLSSGNLKNLAENKNLHFIQADVCDKETKNIYVKFQPFIIFHLAAHYANELSIKEPEIDLETNTKGTLVQLEIARQLGIKRFVYASSSCIYAPTSEALKENDLAMPHTPYGISKLAGEYYCNFYSKIYGLPITIIRYFNAYGPREDFNQYRGVVPRFIEKAIHGLPIIITGNGEETRDFTFVNDSVEGTVLAALMEEGKNQVFNIGTGKAVTILQLAETIKKVSKSSSPIEYLSRRGWDETISRNANIEKAQQMIGYDPQYDLEQGLEETVFWYQKSKYK
ncbi:Nucleoside-diphosphate-sugar epimerase [Geosporobacter subterraneus DSM 17957]|uniref:Nucleoside-diphosphate-sugar epimerase n=1 Tax=Geosporobacter subterraneus DSM 17957 TaxID=1121919 RepID=A0A1M6PKN3_9FIRM|nr:SDR family NAD(P)-dependent oxidoreductase [Geosporobacter subterraneus]SHK08480.1 Nucleoside-diphosphate-sugar epimerase [Geosporobacter subterraneus DSM 17957]